MAPLTPLVGGLYAGSVFLIGLGASLYLRAGRTTEELRFLFVQRFSPDEARAFSRYLVGAGIAMALSAKLTGWWADPYG